ncbi:MAG: 23S rRNA (adenine(2503)-C(2))-methyltransferase RlmN [Victivallaceae bacterium]|nr:23S rRNA (adenine(2503)-C(2))-methyltransferase RlmN [Victivallaceae bacterium]
MNDIPKPLLATVNQAELTDFVARYDQPSFRTKQLLDWVFHKRILVPSQMKNIPLVLRNALEENFCCCSSEVETIDCAGDATEKLLINLRDSNSIEMVIISSPERKTFCLSTQVGCPVQCYFCASGADGLIRNLNAGEMVEQLYHGSERIDALPDNIVFMGIGEGLLNFNNLATAIGIMCDHERLNISPRRITVSTSGYVPGIAKLAQLNLPLNLAVSLHAPNDTIRAKLIPEKMSYPIAEIIEACNAYRANTGRMVTFEYTLIAGINDMVPAAEELAAIARQNRVKVNLIPYNPVSGTEFKRPELSALKNFEAVLLNRGVQTTMRLEKGSSVNAACGQLRASGKK